MKMKTVCLIVVCASCVFADPVTWNFTGRVSQVNNGTNILSVYTLGDTLSGSITVDTALAVLDWEGPSYNIYSGALQSFWLDNGQQNIGFNSRGLINVKNDSIEGFGTVDLLRFYHDTFGPTEFVGDSINGLSISSIQLSLYWPETTFSDNTLPSEIDFNSIDRWGLQITYSKWSPESGTQSEYLFIEPAAVPEPATAIMLFAGGSIAFLVHRLRRWANR